MNNFFSFIGKNPLIVTTSHEILINKAQLSSANALLYIVELMAGRK